jgi:histidinol phosphatase-like PHP family hydrolase
MVTSDTGRTGRPEPPRTAEGWPLVDLHVHPDNSTLDAIAQLSQERGVVFGMVEHAGTRENLYPRVLSCDAELLDWTAAVARFGFYRGVQAEWIDWAGCFSKRALATLDYVLTDTMTYPGPDGRRLKLWEPTAAIDDHAERFMDAFVDWHLAVLEQQPIDVLANVSWLPARHAGSYETLWTDARIESVVAACQRHGVAIEISSGFRLPGRRFLSAAKDAGLKFCFGSNGRYPAMGRLQFSLQAARDLGLTAADFWLPGAAGPRAAC